jgi:adenosine kinase
VVGLDGQDYIDRLAQLGCTTSYIGVNPNAYTSQAFISTDAQHHQITFFHPGAQQEITTSSIHHVQEKIELMIVSPEKSEVMVSRVKEAKSLSIGCLFDPGQTLLRFSPEQLNEALDHCTWLILNEYESVLLQKIVHCSLDELIKRVEVLIITKGEKGSEIYFSSGEYLRIPAIPVDHMVDPTGCGDAYRAGLMYGLLNRWTWLQSARLATLLGSIAVGSQGAQNHCLDKIQISEIYQHHFGESL